MNEEIQKWFTEHGKVLEAVTEEDKGNAVPGTTVIRYKFEDGAELVIRPAKYAEDGTPQQEQQIVTRKLPEVKQGPAQTLDQAAISAANAGQARRLQAEREKNAALPADQDPAYETDEERRKRAEARIKQQGADAEAARQRQRQEEADARQREIDAQNAATRAAQEQRAAAAEQRANRSVIQKNPVTGKQEEIIYGADGRVAEVKELPNQQDAPGTPMGDIPDPAQVSKWLWEQRDQIYSRVGQNGFTKQMADAEVAQRLKFAEALVNERNAATSTAQGIYNTEVGIARDRQGTANNRLSAANSIYNQAISTGLPLVAKMPVGSGQLGATLMSDLLKQGMGFARAMGGLEDAQYPTMPTILQQQRDVRMPGTGGAAGITVTPDGTIHVNTGGGQQGQAQAAPSPAFRPAPPTTPLDVAAAQASQAAQSAVPSALFGGAQGGAPSWLTQQATAQQPSALTQTGISPETLALLDEEERQARGGLLGVRG